MSEDIKIGDTVRLKSGGPVMTVSEIGDYSERTKAWCEWFDDKKPCSRAFALTSLEKIDISPMAF